MSSYSIITKKTLCPPDYVLYGITTIYIPEFTEPSAHVEEKVLVGDYKVGYILTDEDKINEKL